MEKKNAQYVALLCASSSAHDSFRMRERTNELENALKLIQDNNDSGSANEMVREGNKSLRQSSRKI